MTRLNSPLAALAVLLALAAPAMARDVKKGDIKIEAPWSRATPGGAKVAAGFLRITNTGASADRLIAAKAQVSEVVELHEMAMVDGVMKMRALGNGIEIPPGKTVDLKPGGLHMMFIDLKAPIVKGKPFTARLVFEKAGEVEIEFGIEDIGARAPAGSGHHKH